MMERYIDTSLDKEFNTIDSLNWLPFIGQSYFEEKYKTLVIGESHYLPIDEELKAHEEYAEIKDSLDIFKRYKAMASTVEINQTDNTEW